jgi:hypothetical protein
MDPRVIGSSSAARRFPASTIKFGTFDNQVIEHPCPVA